MPSLLCVAVLETLFPCWEELAGYLSVFQACHPHAGCVQGDDPVYVWLPLPAPPPTGPRLTTKTHPGRLPEQTTASPVPELQLHLRLQWVRQVERGQIMHLDFSLEGCGISVVGYASPAPLTSCDLCRLEPVTQEPCQIRRSRDTKWYACSWIWAG